MPAKYWGSVGSKATVSVKFFSPCLDYEDKPPDFNWAKDRCDSETLATPSQQDLLSCRETGIEKEILLFIQSWITPYSQLGETSDSGHSFV
jgi:hypothetical protein